MISVSKVTSTTLLGVPSKSAANKKVLAPRGLFTPFEQRGDPELYLQYRGVAAGLARSSA